MPGDSGIAKGEARKDNLLEIDGQSSCIVCLVSIENSQ